MSDDHSTPVKRCLKCRTLKPAGAFSPEKRNRDGLQGRCRACAATARKEAVSRPGYHRGPAPKRCGSCGAEKPPEDYSPDRRSMDGLQGECRACNLERHRSRASTPEGRAVIARWEKRSKLKYRYGLTEAEYRALLVSQGGLCAICRKPPEGGKRTQRLHVDHDHESGKVRGLTCNGCNRALGQFGDTLEGVMRVVDYLKRSPT